jgi:transposase InsO family protein
MNIHKNARLTPLGRERMVCRILAGQTPEAAALAAGVCPATARKWLKRFLAEGVEGLADRSSRPKSLRNETPPETADRIVALRRRRWTGGHIARETGVSSATVSRILKRAGLSRLKDLQPAEPARRYEYGRPGDMIHLDIKKLGRFEQVGHRITGDRRGQSAPRARKTGGYGWEYVHFAIDDHSRLSFTQIHPDEKAASAVAHLRARVAWYASLGVTIKRVLTDNGSCYKSHAFARACRELGLRHIRTKPYTPRTNGKAERFIQTALREWAYARAYETSRQRAEICPNLGDG